MKKKVAASSRHLKVFWCLLSLFGLVVVVFCYSHLLLSSAVPTIEAGPRVAHDVKENVIALQPVTHMNTLVPQGNDDSAEESNVEMSASYARIVAAYGRSTPSNQSCPHPSAFHSWRKRFMSPMGPPLKKDCNKLRQNPAQEVKSSNLSLQLRAWRNNTPWVPFAQNYQKMSCDEIRKEFQNNFYVSEIEKDFPIAYIFVVYKAPGQILRLLKAIYRPHNLYCIHPDARQGKDFKGFFDNIANCLDNVFVVSKPIEVYYGHISITDAQLNCMQDLEKYPRSRWKYAINLCGREIPLQTNREIVKSLQKLKGYSAINAYPLPGFYELERLTYKFGLDAHGIIHQTKDKQAKPPSGIKLHKSMNFIVASPDFVRFILHDPISTGLHDYLTTALDPEEHFYSSLYVLPQATGARPPTELLNKSDIPIVDSVIWVIDPSEQVRNKICPGKTQVHHICILSAMEMQNIHNAAVNSEKVFFFFNKYYLELDPTPMDCMEEALLVANMNEYMKDCLSNFGKDMLTSFD
jgi:hypothetical protein